MTQFEVQVVDEAEPVVVRLLGELDLAVADDLADSVKPYLTRGRAVVGDLAGLSFVDSAGLATFGRVSQSSEAVRIRFLVEGARGQVAMVLEDHRSL